MCPTLESSKCILIFVGSSIVGSQCNTMSHRKEVKVSSTRKRKATSQGKQVVGLIQQSFVWFSRQLPEASPNALHQWATSSQCAKSHSKLVVAGKCSAVCPSGGKPLSGIKYIYPKAMATRALVLLPEKSEKAQLLSKAQYTIQALVSYNHTN